MSAQQIIVRPLADKQEILALLQDEPVYAAYAIGDLADGLFEQCRWYAADGGGHSLGLAMTFGGLEPPVLYVQGKAEGVQAIITEALHPDQAYFSLKPEHVPAVVGMYRLDEPRRMYRMVVDAEHLQPAAVPEGVRVKRLYPGDIRALNELYAWGGAAFFSAYQLENGVYYAVEEQGQLVAAAGTHVVSPAYGVAAVGNVYTHPRYRNRGYATASTGAVTQELLAMGCPTVVLNVRQDNAPAVHAYERLGYRVHCPFLEMPGQHRGPVGELVQKLVGQRRYANGPG